MPSSTEGSQNNNNNNNNNGVSLWNYTSPPRINASYINTNSNDSSSSLLGGGLMSPLSSHYSASTLNFGRYFSRQSWNAQFSKLDQYMYTDEQNFIGWYSPWYFINWCIFAVVPAAYVYIGLVVLRELCVRFPDTIYQPIQYYTPWIGKCVQAMQNVSWTVEIWCYIEAVFFIGMKLRIKYLNAIDPLEASLAAAPLMDSEQRQVLWNRMMEISQEHAIEFIRGWFFGSEIENISKYDIRDFIAWSMFEGRHQEHLTVEELRQLERFVRDAEDLISDELDRLSNNENNDNNEGDEYDEENENPQEEHPNHAVVEDETEYEDSKQTENDIIGIVDNHEESIDIIENHDGNSNKKSSLATNNESNENDHKTTKRPNEGRSSNTGGIGGLSAKKQKRESKKSSSKRREFRFRKEIQHEEPNFFSDLFASYRNAVGTMRDLHPSMEDLRNMVTNVAHVKEIRSMVNHAATEMSDLVLNNSVVSSAPVQELRNMVTNAANEAMGEMKFRPVQEIRNFMAETGKQLEKAEESAFATATQMYTTLVPPFMDQRLTAMSHATYTQLMDAWNSVKNIRERLEMARFLSKQRQKLRQQLKGYRAMLNTVRANASAVPPKQLAYMMRRITECNERMDLLEGTARAAFVNTTGFTLKNIPGFSIRHEPQRYAKFSSDPLLGLATYPLGFHLFVLGCSELPLRILMRRRGFERRNIGPITYYYHPGKDATDYNSDGYDSDEASDDMRSQTSKETASDDDVEEEQPLPFVFVHGIGLGLLPYMPLIDALLETGRPIFLPEIPYVSGFRPWQSTNSVLQPAVVTSTMTAMLATHGYIRATWLGHSYGTTWLSYMCQFASTAVAAVLFYDPICFCLHYPFLAKQFVYSRPDPGRIAYIVRTDAIVNYTIQRSFPWAWIALFLEQIGDRPCQIYLSDNDALVPAARIQHYLERNQIPIRSYCSRQNKFLDDEDNDGNNDDENNCDNNDDDDITVSNRRGPRLSRKLDEKLKKTQQSNNTTTRALYPNTRCIIFRGDGHGDWTERSAPLYKSIAEHALNVCLRAEKLSKRNRTTMMR